MLDPHGETDMKKNGRFMVGLVGVATVVTYLIWTGVSETMVYYLTPVELLARVKADPTFHDVGIKVSGQVVKGTYSRVDGVVHTFTVHDLADPTATFRAEYRSTLPATFTDEVEVVLEGRLREDGVFEATTLLTKCGSRYEAAPEDLAG
jgi:cytochrome c-type biogenesis protein CcmE